MVLRHIIRPAAGRMRPNTISSGILSTKRRRPVSTSRFTRILVPNPKKAFQSPGVHRAGFVSVVALVIRTLLSSLVVLARETTRFDRPRAPFGPSYEGPHHFGAIRYPAEDASLGLDHA